MALILKIRSAKKQRQTLHGETICLASVFIDDRSNRYIQLDTYGARTRKFQEKISQTMQFNEAAAAQLKKLIEEVFPGVM